MTGNLLRDALYLALATLMTTWAQQSKADDLTLLFVSAPSNIDWSRPDRVFVTTFRNILTLERERASSAEARQAGFGLASHAISHVDVRVRCKGQPEHYSGMTSVKHYAGMDQLLKNAGFEIVLTPQEGRFVTPDEIQSGIRLYQANGRLAFLKIEIRPETCQRLMDYAREYVERGYQRIFGGLQHRPRYGEGSGCAAYGASFLEIAGLLDSEMREKWRRKILIPEDLIGRPGRPARLGFYDYVVAGRRARWAERHEPHTELEFWDPQLMYNWVRQVWSDRPEDQGYEYLQIENSYGIRVDRTDVPTPTESFWKSD